jgi:hypothetical protein
MNARLSSHIENTIARGGSRRREALIGLIAAAAVVLPQAAASAQQAYTPAAYGVGDIAASRSTSAANIPADARLSRVPAQVASIFDRAGDMLGVAQDRSVTAHTASARAEYRVAARELRKFLNLGGYGRTGDPGTLDMVVTPGQARSDAQSIRNAALDERSPLQAAILKRAAALYENAAENIVAADQREIAFASSGDGGRTGYASASASELPPVRHTDYSRPAVKVVIHGSEYSQRQARQQGIQELQAMYAQQNDNETTASAVASANAANNGYGQTGPLPAYPYGGWLTAPYGTNALAAQAYLNSGQNLAYGGPYFGDYGYYPGTFLPSANGGYVTPLTPFGGDLVPNVPSGVPEISVGPAPNAVAPNGAIFEGPGLLLQPNPIVPQQITPAPIVVAPVPQP